MTPERSIAVFDLGGVLIDWNPRHLYRKLIPDPDEMERFLAEICSPEWNLEQDRGRSWAEATQMLVKEYPDQEHLIRAYRQRWPEMLGGPIAGSVDVLRDLRDRSVPLYALTNWSHETFDHAMELYDFLGWFQDILVSGRELIVKPDPAIFRRLLDRNGLNPADAVFIDDNPKNATAATAIGMHGIHFTTPDALRRDLTTVGLI